MDAGYGQGGGSIFAKKKETLRFPAGFHVFSLIDQAAGAAA
jgi:hypothetical protein